MLFFILYSIHFFFSLFFCSNRLHYNNRLSRAGQDVMGPTRVGIATKDRIRGQAGGKRRETSGL